MTEAQLQQAVIECAQLLGWRVAHFRPALTARGWRTPVAADGVGFPDLVLVRDRVLFVELKSARGRIGVEQRAWQDALQAAGAVSAVWTPRDWSNGYIEGVLRAEGERVAA